MGQWRRDDNPPLVHRFAAQQMAKLFYTKTQQDIHQALTVLGVGSRFDVAVLRVEQVSRALNMCPERGFLLIFYSQPKRIPAYCITFSYVGIRCLERCSATVLLMIKSAVNWMCCQKEFY